MSKMKNKAWITILFIFQALPIPISQISILGSIISIANIGMAESFLEMIIPIIAMLLAGAYTIPYIIALRLTIKNKKIHIYSFVPIMHLAPTMLFFVLWANL